MQTDEDLERRRQIRQAMEWADRPLTWRDYAFMAFVGGSMVAGLVGGIAMRLSP